MLNTKDVSEYLKISPNGLEVSSQDYISFKVFPAVTMKNAFLRDVTPCGSCKTQLLRGTYRLKYEGGKNQGSRNC
jgi:hypothetical protein